MSTTPITPDSSLGPMFFGMVGASALFGITTIQMYLYYHYYPTDSRLHKAAVGVLWILATFHQALLLHATYTYLIGGWGEKDSLEQILWSVKLEVLVNVAIVVIVQGLYAYRIFLLSGIYKKLLGYGVAVIVLAGAGIGIVFVYHLYGVHAFADLDRVSWAIIAALASSTAIDFTLSGAMCYYLYKFQVPDDSDLNSRIATIIQYTLSTGLCTSACSLSTLFTYAILPHTFIFMGLEYLLVQLYVGSFFALLNARERKSAKSSPPSSPVRLLNSQQQRLGSPQISDKSSGPEIVFAPFFQNRGNDSVDTV